MSFEYIQAESGIIDTLESSTSLIANLTIGSPPAITSGKTIVPASSYRLPIGDGTAGQQLQTNGSGTCSWAAAFTVKDGEALRQMVEQLKSKVTDLESKLATLSVISSKK